MFKYFFQTSIKSSKTPLVITLFRIAKNLKPQVITLPYPHVIACSRCLED